MVSKELIEKIEEEVKGEDEAQVDKALKNNVKELIKERMRCHRLIKNIDSELNSKNPEYVAGFVINDDSLNLMILLAMIMGAVSVIMSIAFAIVPGTFAIVPGIIFFLVILLGLDWALRYCKY